jgi:UDP-N-acetylglucosamine 1-carboxyvinyltransferase
MEQFVIQGPTKLQGKVTISGSKNAALPIIAATALIKGKVTLKNIPNIKDVTALADLLCQLGAFCEYKDNTLTIDATTLKSVDPDPKLIRNLRASILLISPLLVRNKKISLPHPGGCLIGARPIDVHLVALTKMGAEVAESSSEYTLSADSLKGAEVTADFSVTGTENIVMGAVLAKGETKVI